MTNTRYDLGPGLSPAAINYVEELVALWEGANCLTLVVRPDNLLDDETRRVVAYQQKFLFLYASHGMHQVWFEVVDVNNSSFGLVRPFRENDENDSRRAMEFNRALEFFIQEMGLEENNVVRARVHPITISNDTVCVTFP
jgi:hypothetical protein